MTKQEKAEKAYRAMQAAEAAHKAAPSPRTAAALAKAGDAFELAEARAMFSEN